MPQAPFIDKVKKKHQWAIKRTIEGDMSVRELIEKLKGWGYKKIPSAWGITCSIRTKRRHLQEEIAKNGTKPKKPIPVKVPKEENPHRLTYNRYLVTPDGSVWCDNAEAAVELAKAMRKK